jgi:hypothetical protein
MTAPGTALSRRSLYARVWREPLAVVAREFGISEEQAHSMASP